MRILVIEEDIHLAAVLERRLRRGGFDVQHSELGEEGIYQAPHRPFDRELLALNLPDMHGSEMLRHKRGTLS